MNNSKVENIGKKIPSWPGKVLLIVEDEDHNYTYIHEILKRTHVGLIRAETGREAVSLFRQHKVDMVLMDIKLPDVDGYIITQEMKRINQDIPVIAQTAYAMVQEREKCLQAGCDDYISKPFDPDKLIRLVERYINQGNTQAETGEVETTEG
ncbi:MAG: response regulator [Bacteroidales bacterium]|nr:response regulator [Bacteroidales bacterium]